MPNAACFVQPWWSLTAWPLQVRVLRQEAFDRKQLAVREAVAIGDLVRGGKGGGLCAAAASTRGPMGGEHVHCLHYTIMHPLLHHTLIVCT